MKGHSIAMGSDLGEAEDYSTYFFTGNEPLARKDLADAERCLDRAMHQAPAGALPQDALLAPLEKVQGRTEVCYALALALDPHCLEAYLNLGGLLTNQERFREGEALYERAIHRFPRHTAPWRGLGILLLRDGQDARAEECLRRALELSRGNLRARFALAQLLLRQGRFEEGWQAMEARALNAAYQVLIPAPCWQGESLTGKALLIAQEGGHGDMLQFSRYVPILKELGAARTGIVCQPALKELFATLPGIDDVVARGETIPDQGWDFWTLPLSLPRICGTTLATIPVPIPYLRPLPDRVAAWRSRLPPRGPRVGLAWKGNPLQENDGDRSLPALDLLAPLAREGVHFISLQKGPGEGEAARPPRGLELLDGAPWIEDFADAAALLAHLDLVISVDSAMAHLAGALGRPCWVLLPHHRTDWRWLEGREDSPWYPTLRLFRQGADGSWPPVIEKMGRALDAWNFVRG